MDDLKERWARLRESLDGIIDPDSVEYHKSVTSTQLRAHELAREGARAALVIADEQTAARGRAARRWEAPKDSGLYFSVLHRPALPPATAHLVNVAAALAVADAVKFSLSIVLRLKWPNDLLIEKEGRTGDFKVCGILSESSVRGGALDYCITGIGLNLYEPTALPADVTERAGWLTREKTIDRVNLLVCIVKNFLYWLDLMEREGVARVLEVYRGRCASVGRAVRVETDEETLSGLCSGVGDEGELILETPEGPRRFHVADVTHAKLE